MFRAAKAPAHLPIQPAYALYQVNEELVKTSEGRKKYHDFLVHHPTITPIKKIFGLTVTGQETSNDVKAHLRRLYLYIHPDKVATFPPEEIVRCDAIFKIVNQAEEDFNDAAKGGKVASGVFFPAVSMQTLVSKEAYFFMENEKWVQARQAVNRGSPDSTASLMLGIAIDLRLAQTAGSLGPIIQRLSPDLPKTRSALIQCQEALDAAERDGPIAASQKLIAALETMKMLHTIYGSERKESYPEADIFKNAIPYPLFVHVRKNFQECGEHLLYECHLRNAIRFCPNYYIEAKRELVDELKQWLKDVHSVEHVQLPFQPEMGRAYEGFTDRLQRSSFSKTHREKIVQAMLDKQSLHKALEKIFNEKYSLTAEFFETQGKIAGHNDDYLKRIRPTVDRALDELEGYIRYFESAYPESAHQFLKLENHLCLGFVQSDARHYRRAIANFENVDRSKNHIFKAMNNCDLELLPQENYSFEIESLKLVDGIQIVVLAEFQAASTLLTRGVGGNKDPFNFEEIF